MRVQEIDMVRLETC